LSSQPQHIRSMFTLYRVSLCVFFLIYAYIVAKGLIPLPDEPPRINFWGTACTTFGVVAAYYCLVSEYRMFLVGLWLFIPLAMSQMNTKIRFLEMMLEPHNPQIATQYGLFAVFLALISPVAMRTFHKPTSAYRSHHNLLLQKGIPF
jgi:hypothetical protein